MKLISNASAVSIFLVPTTVTFGTSSIFFHSSQSRDVTMMKRSDLTSSPNHISQISSKVFFDNVQLVASNSIQASNVDLPTLTRLDIHKLSTQPRAVSCVFLRYHPSNHRHCCRHNYILRESLEVREQLDLVEAPISMLLSLGVRLARDQALPILI